MRFKDKKTGNIIVAKTTAVIESFKKNPLFEAMVDTKQEEKPQANNSKGNK